MTGTMTGLLGLLGWVPGVTWLPVAGVLAVAAWKLLERRGTAR